MSTHAHDHEPFDRDEWAASLSPGHEIEVTAPTPSILDPDRDEPGLHPAEPVACSDCGRVVMLVSEDRRTVGHCPFCGTDHVPGRDS